MLCQKNSKKQWDVWLWVAICYFAKLWYTISIPLTDSQDYDLVVDFEWKLNKIQVKTTRYKKKNWTYVVLLKTLWWNKSWNTVKLFTENNCDYLFVVTNDWVKYLIPNKNLPWNNLTLSKSQDKYIVE